MGKRKFQDTSVVNLRISVELLGKVDAEARAKGYGSRSEYIRSKLIAA